MSRSERVPVSSWLVVAGLLYLLALSGCVAPPTDPELEAIKREIAGIGGLFGPQGVLASTALIGVMTAGVKTWRYFRGDRAMTQMAAGTAGAIVAAQKGASEQEVAAILTESIPGKAAKVEPAKVAEIVATAKEAA